MIYWKLFLTFLEIGAVSFGGGYGMLSLMRELTLANGWLTEQELLNFIAVAESTPGPIAVNMATFVGASQGGILGSFLATLGVVLPSFVIILLIVAILKNVLKHPATQGALQGIRPCVVGLIIGTALILMLSTLFGIGTIQSGISVNPIGIGIFLIVVLMAVGYKKWKKKPASPILLIAVSAVLGGVLYGL